MEYISYIVGRLGNIGVGRDRHDEAVVVMSCDKMDGIDVCKGRLRGKFRGRKEKVEIRQGIVSLLRE